MDEKIFNENLKERIYTLNKTIWENKINGQKITNWLNNFETDEEKSIALYLLSEFMYFGDIQLKVLLKTLYRDLFRYPIINQIRIDNAHTLDSNIIEPEYHKILYNTRFFSIGNPSASSAHLMYYFRQENNLPTCPLFDENGIDYSKLKYVIFIDDFCGTGSQVTSDVELITKINQIRATNSNIVISYFMLVGTTHGIQNIILSKLFDKVEAVIEIDDTFKCFSPDSRLFKGIDLPYDITTYKETVYKYGFPLIKSISLGLGHDDTKSDMIAHFNALGFGDCQLLLG
ncbi:MAG TPA: hypothetical protein VIK86_00745, partial [Candidatus Paceibacterota bacterium]